MKIESFSHTTYLLIITAAKEIVAGGDFSLLVSGEIKYLRKKKKSSKNILSS